MKRIVFAVALSLLLVMGLFVLTGCEKAENVQNTSTNTETVAPSEETKQVAEPTASEVTLNNVKYTFKDEGEFHDMKFKYQDDAPNFKIVDNGDEHRGLIFYQDGSEGVLFRDTLSINKGKDISFVCSMKDIDQSTLKKRTFNNLEWYDYYDTKSKSATQFYYYQNGADIYSVAFTVENGVNVDIQDFIVEFMSNVSFE